LAGAASPETSSVADRRDLPFRATYAGTAGFDKPDRNSAYARLARMLDLTTQRDCIRYDLKHFQRCDMTVEEMVAQQKAEIARGGPDAREARLTHREFSNVCTHHV